MKTLTMLMKENSITFNGKWFQPINLKEKIEKNWKEYVFWIPFIYFLTDSNKRRVQFSIDSLILRNFPNSTLLEDQYWLSSAYDLCLELTKKYISINIVRYIQSNIDLFITAGYLIEKRNTNVLSWSQLFENLFWKDIDFNDLTSWKVKPLKDDSFWKIEILTREDVKKTKELLGITNYENERLETLKAVLMKLGVYKWVRNLNSNQARTYYIRIINDVTLKRNEVKRELTDDEKDIIVTRMNNVIDSIANLIKSNI